MAPTRWENILVWGFDNIEAATLLQAGKASRLPFVEGHIALMPDAHVGIGAAVGSVIPTRGVVIPAAVGVDIGCGMIALQTRYSAEHLPDNLDVLMPLIEQSIPAGIGKGRARDVTAPLVPPTSLTEDVAFTCMDERMRALALKQLGTLGSGNHFLEVCLDQDDFVWIVLHSGSRGVGNKLANTHIDIAKGLMKEYFVHLEDPDLAYLVEGTPEFEAYIRDMLWAQDYALANREAMMDAALRSLDAVVNVVSHGPPIWKQRINCHHNFTQRESVDGRNLWITRKGAISARQDERGVIPGSMGTASYVVTGNGTPASYYSSSHGAGRRMSRGAARREISVDEFVASMTGTWNASKASALVDEAPAAYKDIDQVMAAQSDLVRVTHTLHHVFNYKGT
jgi:tRNA-splicing ligase RtcB